MTLVVNNECSKLIDMDQDKKQMSLYSVVVISPTKGVETYHVLAQTPEDATGMAQCAAGLAMYQVPKDIHALVKCHTTRLPLVIQGWGKAQF